MVFDTSKGYSLAIKKTFKLKSSLPIYYISLIQLIYIMKNGGPWFSIRAWLYGEIGNSRNQGFYLPEFQIKYLLMKCFLGVLTVKLLTLHKNQNRRYRMKKQITILMLVCWSLTAALPSRTGSCR